MDDDEKFALIWILSVLGAVAVIAILVTIGLHCEGINYYG